MRTITGQVLSGWDQTPIAGAHLVLYLDVDGELIPLGTGTTTDNSGEFILSYVPGGSDQEVIKIQHVSYEDGTIYPQFVNPGEYVTRYLTVASYEVPEATVTAWVYRNGNAVWLVATVLILTALLIISENGNLARA